MKMFRASFAAILGAVALGDNTSAPTESNLTASEHARDSALEHANQTLHNIMRTEQASRLLVENEELVDQEVATIEAAFPNTTEHYARQREHMMDERQQARKQAARGQVQTAKSAANAYKHAARELETQRRHAGLPEHVYEGGFDVDEGQSEGWHDEAENYGDYTENHIEEFYDRVEGKIEQHAEREREHEEQRHEEEENRRYEDHYRRQYDPHYDQQDDDHQGGNATRNHTDQQSNAVNLASTALNLRAVASNPSNGPQGFLLTFAFIGFLASMAFAVQMQSRPTRSPAQEPLLGA